MIIVPNYQCEMIFSFLVIAQKPTEHDKNAFEPTLTNTTRYTLHTTHKQSIHQLEHSHMTRNNSTKSVQKQQHKTIMKKKLREREREKKN